MLLYDVLKAAIPQNVAEFTRPIQSWVPGVTPISTTPAVITASLTYLVVVLGGQYLMRSLPAVPSKYVRLPFFLHNVLLSLGSLVLLVLYLERMLPFMLRFGIHNSVCLREVHSPEMEFLHIVNYYFKYWELLDTVFLVLKKKPLLFLHVYHHMATAALCYTQILGRTPMAWAVISLNLAVHVIMYGYYALSSLGIRCQWKKLITTNQIVQFVIDLFICCYGSMYLIQAELTQPGTTTLCSTGRGCRTLGTVSASRLPRGRALAFSAAIWSSSFSVRRAVVTLTQSIARRTRPNPRSRRQSKKLVAMRHSTPPTEIRSEHAGVLYSQNRTPSGYTMI